jgi:uncharacterized ferredoxin-like protein
MGTLTVVAELMEIAARTAPKARGQDFIVMSILEGEALQPLVDKMAEIGERTARPFFVRDSKNVAASEVVLLIGIRDAQKAGLNCGACGVPTCADLNTNSHAGEFSGPQCAFRVLDLGIAVGSAAKTASMFNADNRVMYTIGAAARELGLIDADFVMGIPLSATGKSIYYDRPPAT